MNTYQKQNNIRNKQAKNQPIYSNRTHEIVGYAIPDRMTSSNVPHQVYLTNEVIEHFNLDDQDLFFTIRDMQNERLLPRMGSESRPLKMRDLELYERNKKLGKRHWQYISETSWRVRQSTGYDSVYGYGYYTENGFVLVDGNDESYFVVEDQYDQ